MDDNEPFRLANTIIEVRALLALLESPELGLATWREAVDRRAHVIAWTFGYAENPDGTD